MELKIVQPEISSSLPAVQWNYEQMKEELENAVKKYEGIVFSEEQVKEAKATRANLNNFKNALETKRKEIKNYFLQPYNDFEAQYKTLLTLIDKPINEIDSQVKKFEEAEKAEKKELIKSVFEDNNPLPGIVNFEQIFNPKWLNATVKTNAVIDEVAGIIEKIKNELTTIKTVGGEYESRMLDKYYQTLDINTAIAEKTRLETLKKREEELKAKEAEAQAAYPVTEEAIITEPKVEPAYVPEDLEQVDFRVWVTKEQKAMIREFLKNNNIKYGSVNNVA